MDLTNYQISGQGAYNKDGPIDKSFTGKKKNSMALGHLLAQALFGYHL